MASLHGFKSDRKTTNECAFLSCYPVPAWKSKHSLTNLRSGHSAIPFADPMFYIMSGLATSRDLKTSTDLEIRGSLIQPLNPIPTQGNVHGANQPTELVYDVGSQRGANHGTDSVHDVGSQSSSIPHRQSERGNSQCTDPLPDQESEDPYLIADLTELSQCVVERFLASLFNRVSERARATIARRGESTDLEIRGSLIQPLNPIPTQGNIHGSNQPTELVYDVGSQLGANHGTDLVHDEGSQSSSIPHRQSERGNSQCTDPLPDQESEDPYLNAFGMENLEKSGKFEIFFE